MKKNYYIVKYCVWGLEVFRTLKEAKDKFRELKKDGNDCEIIKVKIDKINDCEIIKVKIDKILYEY